MSNRLKIKLKVSGKKFNKVVYFVMMPKQNSIKGNFIEKLGFWDTRKNWSTRFIILNIYKIMFFYRNGLTPSKKTINFIYYFFFKKVSKNSYEYFFKTQFKFFLENEIKKKFIIKK